MYTHKRMWNLERCEGLPFFPTTFTRDYQCICVFFVSLSSAWVPTHDAFGIVRNCCGIPSAAGSLPACSLFLLHSGVMPLRCVALGKQAHTSDFALWQLASSVNLSKRADGWMEASTVATVVMPTVSKCHRLFWGTLLFPKPIKKQGTCAHEIVTQPLVSAIQAADGMACRCLHLSEVDYLHLRLTSWISQWSISWTELELAMKYAQLLLSKWGFYSFSFLIARGRRRVFSSAHKSKSEQQYHRANIKIKIH